MKIKITEIEANAEELRQSSTLADGLSNILRNCFNGPFRRLDEVVEESEEKDDIRRTES